MTRASNRRVFLQGALGSVAGLSLPAAMFPAFAKSEASLTATSLHDDLLLISGAGANVLAARDAHGVLLVDGGTKQRSSELLKFVKQKLSAKRVHTLFNTHWHPEQTGSNEKLGQEGARIIAHENTRLWLRAESPLPSGEGVYGPLPPKACPNDTIYTTASLPFGTGRIEYGYLLQAHTDGDIYVHFRDANVLMAGGVVSNASWPVIDWRTGGWIGGMVAGLRKLATLANAETRIVPADGPVLTQAELNAQIEMYAAIYGRLQKLLRSGMSPAEAVAAKVTGEYQPQWGSSDRFVTQAFQSLWGQMTPDA